MATTFDFIQSFRDLDPNAAREVIDARQKSHGKIQAGVKTMDRIYDLCRLAFLLEPHPETEWFEKPIRDLDPHFLVRKDKAEAGRIAALLLRDRMTWTGSVTPLAVLSVSFCGRRHSADGNVLTNEANEALSAGVRLNRLANADKSISPPKFKLITAELDAVAAQNPLSGPAAKGAIEAAMASSEAAVKSLAEVVQAALSPVRNDVAKLAEEVDMLWWHIGDWHELLGKPRSSTSAETRMLASGVELGELVRQLPGPYGAYGILRRIAGSDGEGKTSLRRTIKALSQNDAVKLSKELPLSSGPLFPVHAALQSFARHGVEWEADFAKSVPEIVDVEMSFFDIGLQAYRERALIQYGGLPQ